MGPFDQNPDDSLAEMEQNFNPPMPVQYSQADNLKRQRLEAGLSAVQDDMDNWILHPEYGDPLVQSISSRLATLYQRREAAQQQEQARQAQQLMHQNAMQQSLLQLDATNDAKNFVNRTAGFTEPLTGQQAHFFQTEPGKWQQVDFGEPSSVSDAANLGDLTPSPDTGEDDVSGGWLAMQTEQPGQGETKHVASEPDGSQRITVMNGAYRTEATYDPNGRLVAEQSFDPRGRPLPQGTAQAADAFGVPLSVMGQITAQAQHMFPGRDIHSQKGQRDYILQQTGLWKAKQLQTARENAQIAKEQRIAQQKAEQEHGDKWVANYDRYFNSAVSHWQSAHKDQEMPDNVRARLDDEARKRADSAHMDAYGKLPKSRQQAIEQERQAGLEKYLNDRAFVNQVNQTAEKAPVKPLPTKSVREEDVDRKIAELLGKQRALPRPDVNPSTGFRTISKFD